MNVYVKSITCSNAYIQSKFNTITGTKTILKATSANWESDAIDTSIVPNGSYTINLEVCAKDTTNKLTEVCKTNSRTLTFNGGAYSG